MMTQTDTEDGILIVDGAFAPVEPDEFVTLPLEEIENETNHVVDLTSDIDPHEHMTILLAAPAIRIAFPSSADGRGYSIASALRRAGYRGHLRAKGHVLADQYPLALRSGFDDVEIPQDLAKRQPEQQWADALTRIQGGYRERLMQGESRKQQQAA